MTKTTMSAPVLAAGCVVLSAAYVLRDPDDVRGVALLAAALTTVAGVLLLLAGLHALLPALRARAGRLGVVAARLFLVGLPVAELPLAFIASAGDAGERAEALVTDQAPPFVVLMLALAATNLGMLLLGVAVVRARSLPTVAGVVLALAPVVMMAAPDLPYGEAMILSAGFLALAWTGLSLQRPAPELDNTGAEGALLVQ